MDLKTLFKISYGMYVVSARNGDKLNGQIVNTAFQVTAEPPTIAVSIHRDNLTNEYIRSSGSFSVSILRQETPLEFIGTFGFRSGRDVNKFDGIKYQTGINGNPIVLEHCLGYLEVKVIGQMEVNTHTIFVGQIVDAVTLADGEVMTYAYYHQVKRGNSSKNAPTYGNAAAAKEIATGTTGQYRCSVCGYLYDPAQGDPAAGVNPGTSFVDLPDTWICPVCGVGKSEFVQD